MSTRYYPTTSTRATCLGDGDDLTLSRSAPGSTTWTSATTSSETFVQVATFDIDVRADGATPTDGSGTIRISINSIDSDTEVRWKVDIIDSTTGCTIQSSSSYFTYSTSGLKSDGITFGIGAWTGNNVLRVTVEVRRVPGGHGNKSVTFDIGTTNTSVLTPWTISTTVGVNAASVTSTPKALSVTLGSLTVGLNVGSVTATPKAITGSTAAPQTVGLNAASIAATPKALSRILGAITESVNPALVTAGAKALGVVLGALTAGLSAATLTATPQAATAVPGALTIGLNAASATATPQEIDGSISQTVILDRALTIFLPKSVSVVNPGITLDAASVGATPKALSTTMGAITAYLPPASLTAVALSIDTKEKHLNAATLRATAFALAASIIGCDHAAVVTTPKEVSVVKSGSSVPVSHGFEGLLATVGDTELQGDAVWIESGSPSVTSGANGLVEACYAPTSTETNVVTTWTAVPIVIYANFHTRIDEDPPNTTDYLQAVVGPTSKAAFLVRNVDIASFPELPYNAKILKVMVKFYGRNTLLANATWYPMIFFGTSWPPDYFYNFPALTESHDAVYGGDVGEWTDMQLDLDRFPSTNPANPNEGEKWTEALVRSIYGFGMLVSGSYPPGGGGIYQLSAMKLCVVYTDPNNEQYPQGILMLDSTSGAWHHWRSKDN